MPWSDKHTLQFRAEAYNALNHTNFSDPPTSTRPLSGKSPLKPTPTASCNSLYATSFNRKPRASRIEGKNKRGAAVVWLPFLLSDLPQNFVTLKLQRAMLSFLFLRQ
jgi:hypothetical protein